MTVRAKWNAIAVKALLGKKIVAVEYMPSAIAEERGWYYCPVVIKLDDGSILVPSSDDEGNDAGVINIERSKECSGLPVISLGE